MDPRRWSLARQVLALMAIALAVVVCVATLAAYVQARRATLDAARQRALSVATTVAQSPQVRAALAAADAGGDASGDASGPRSSSTLQPYAEEVRAGSATDFVVIMSPTGTRYTHPDPSRIGQQFLGHIDAAAHGTPLTETYTGTLGPSVRAVVPVFAPAPGGTTTGGTTTGGTMTGGTTTGGTTRVVGLVAVGITLETVSRSLSQQVPTLVGAGLLALVATGLAAVGLSRRLRRQTHGMGPADLTRMYEFYDAVLHAVREGLLLLDRDGRLELANDEAVRLLGLAGDAVGRHVTEVGLPAPLAQALAGGDERTDEVHLAGPQGQDRVLVVSQAPAIWGGRRLGTVVTLRDRTDLLALTGELDSVRSLAESLRSQAHESANRMHAVVSLIELGRHDTALELATAELAGVQQLTDRVVAAVGEPVLAALLLGKAAQAAERGVELVLDDDLDVPETVVDGEHLDQRDLVTIVGNLVDNAMDAALLAPAPRQVGVGVRVDADGVLVLRVWDTGPGLDEADVERAFVRGWSTKTPTASNTLVGRGLGLALVGRAVRRCDGTIAVERPAVAGAPGSGAVGPGAVFVVRIPLVRNGSAVRGDVLQEQR